jgi:hypothetical protein
MRSLRSSALTRPAAILSSFLLACSCLVYAKARSDAAESPRTGLLGARRGPTAPAGREPLTARKRRAAADGREQTRAAARPIDFVENRGQWGAAVKFSARRGAMMASFEERAIRLRLGKERPATVALNFEGASRRARLAGENERAGRYNFYVGNNPKRWRANVPTYGGVVYRGLYEGVDLRVREAAGRLEYDVLLAPGVDLDRVVIRADGAKGLELAEDGSLVVRTAAGDLRQTPPVTWEELPGGGRRYVECRFRKIDSRRYGFSAPARDRALALVVDPGLEWSTYLGGGEWDEVHDIAAADDDTGDVIAVGATLSDDFSGRANPVAGFVTRFSASGALVYKTILSGSDREWVLGMAAAPGGEAVVVGESYSPDYPTTAGAYQTAHGVRFDSLGPIYAADAFVTRLNAAGQIVYSTFLGTDVYDAAYAVALTNTGQVILAGETAAADFPTTDGAYDRTHNCCTPYFEGVFSRLDAFVARLSADGSALEYSTYLGGHGDEPPESIVVDAGGFVTLTGSTISAPGGGPHFPTTADALSRTPFNFESNPDAYLARLKLDGAGAADLKYSTFLGGGNTDEGYSVALDPLNPQDVIVGGVTYSTAGVSAIFPTTAGTMKPSSTSIDGFLMRFRFPTSGGGQLVWSTFFGGSDYEDIGDVAVNGAGEIVITGETRSFDLPTTPGAYDRTVAISSGNLFFDAYAARVSGDGASVLYGSYLGGSFNERVPNVALLGATTAALSGWTNSGNFPTTPGAHDNVLNNDGVGGPGGFGGVPFDGFLARLSLLPDGDGDDAVSAPSLLTPANNAQVPTNTATTFDWSDVPDPAGVEGYHIQINQRPDFVCCNDWQEVWTTASQHVASVRFDGPYYWRVRTADRSGNLSDWSEVRTFNSGTTISTLSVNPTTVEGGNTAQGQVTLTALAPVGGITISLSSSNPSVANVPASVSIPQGSASAAFAVTTANVSAPTAVTITGTHNGNSRSVTLTVTPSAAPPPAPTLISPSNGARVPPNVEITFSWNAAAGAATYEIQIDDSDRFTAPLVASKDGLTQTQYVAVFRSERRHWWRVRGRTAGGTNGAWSAVRSFEVKRGASAPPSAPTLSTLSLSPSTVTGGNSSQGTVTLTSAAPTGGASVALSSSNPAVASVPPSVTVPAGSTSAAFAVTTSSVSASTSATISAAYGGVTRTASLAVQPATTTTPAALSALSLSPTSVTAGGTSQGTVTLTAAAPSGGASVALSSGNAGVVSVPASVLVPAGATSASFTATTGSVTSSTSVTITASYGGVTRTATLTVNPPQQTTDTVSIQLAEYTSDKRELRVEATSTNSSAVLRAYVTSTGELIGTLTNEGGGRYRGQFTWPANPQSITVRSSLGGSATRTVAAK